jgi:hypothetical protein
MVVEDQIAVGGTAWEAGYESTAYPGTAMLKLKIFVVQSIDPKSAFFTSHMG